MGDHSHPFTHPLYAPLDDPFFVVGVEGTLGEIEGGPDDGAEPYVLTVHALPTGSDRPARFRFVLSAATLAALGAAVIDGARETDAVAFAVVLAEFLRAGPSFTYGPEEGEGRA